MSSQLPASDIWEIMRKPFEVHEHMWLQGNPYVKKDALRNRLTLADPGWETTEARLITVQDDVVVMELTLIVRGVSRVGVGTGIIQHGKPDKDGSVNPFNEAKLLAKAYKSAASDALTRAGFEFGAAWYLKSLTEKQKEQVKTPEGLGAYLRDLMARLSGHWCFGPDGEKFKHRMTQLGLDASVLQQLEPSRRIERLSETRLTAAQALARLDVLAQSQKEGGLP